MKLSKHCNRICSPNDCECQQFTQQPIKTTGVWRAIMLIFILLMLSGVLFCQKLPPPGDSIYVAVTKVLHAEDFYKVEGYDIKTGYGYFFECPCKYRQPPKEGEIILIPKPELVKQKRPKRFLFN